MKETAAESAALKTAFKNHFATKGYDSPLPPTLAEEKRLFPLEWGEACEEFEDYGQELAGIRLIAHRI